MIARILNRVNRYFTQGHQRTLLAKKNIFYSFFIKGLSMLASLMIIPLSIRFINPAEFGIWLTLSSVISWMSFFDLGLSNGLRNKLAEAAALGKNELSRILVSTTYALMVLICLIFFGAFLIANHFIDWNKILNSGSANMDLNRLALVVFGLFCIQFCTQTVNTVLLASHMAAKVSLIALAAQMITLTAIYIALHSTPGSLLVLVLINGSVPIVIQLFASFSYYHADLKTISPAFRFINFRYARELFGLGWLFFIIQLGALILFQTDNIVVAQLFGPAQVTTFNVSYKLFSVFILGFNIMMTPFWSAFTDAYTKQDIFWIKRVLKKMRYLWIVIVLLCFCLFAIAPYVYRLWINHAVSVPISLSLAMTCYVIVYSWQTMHVYLLNGINKIRLQFYLVIISSVINIPLAIFLGRRVGLAGVTWSNAILFLFMGTVFWYQTKRLLNGSAKGILDA